VFRSAAQGSLPSLTQRERSYNGTDIFVNVTRCPSPVDQAHCYNKMWVDSKITSVPLLFC
jgi:hypothetical protein